MHIPPRRICRNCGASVDRDETITRSGFTIHPMGHVSYEGRPLHLAPAFPHATILHTLASFDEPCTFGMLTDRLGYDNHLVLRKVVSTLRVALRVAGVPVPFRSAYGVGYEWGPPIIPTPRRKRPSVGMLAAAKPLRTL